MAVHLLFSFAPTGSSPVDLLFGQTQNYNPPVEITIAGALPSLAGNVSIVVSLPSTEITIAGALPSLAGSVVVNVDAGVPAYTTRRVGSPWQDGVDERTAAGSGWGDGALLRGLSGLTWRDADPLLARRDVRWSDATATLARASGSWRDALLEEARTLTVWRDGTAVGSVAGDVWRDAAGLAVGIATSWRDGVRFVHAAGAAWRDGSRGAFVVELGWRDGAEYLRDHVFAWRDGEGVHTHGGPPFVIPPPEPPDPCYTPPPGDAVHLLFADPFGSTNLLFVCPAHAPPPAATIIIPVQAVYIMLNTVTLVRVAGNVPLVATRLSMSLDVDSWTWTWSATLPGTMLQYIDSDPVTEVIATINNQQYRLLIEAVARERSFGTSELRVSGRGRNALLDVQAATFSNANARNAAQLMDEALQVNGVGIGWTVDFGLEDWLVPGGVWSHQGTPMSALRAIAAAGGGYIQPHATGQIVRVLPRYPVAPWNWDAQVTPDYELPSAATVREGIEWVTRPDYNRVFVSGTRNGVLAQVTRQGTAGDQVAPMVTDALTTTVAAGRQRGLSVLGDTGRQARVSLRTPVFQAAGIIVPGKFVRYVDGATTRLGVVRRVQVDAQVPSLAQTLEVETHV